MFADYRVPQILRYLGILEYSASLSQLVDVDDSESSSTGNTGPESQEMAYSCESEVQIRAATVLAVDMILEDFKENGGADISITCAYEVDWLLW